MPRQVWTMLLLSAFAGLLMASVGHCAAVQEVTWHDARDTQLSTLNLGGSSCSTDQQQQEQVISVQQQQQQQAHCSAADHPTNTTTSHEHHLQQQEQEQKQQEEQELVGLILNVAGSGWLSRLLGGRHWIAIRQLQGAW